MNLVKSTKTENLSEKEYRSLDKLSYSALKDYCKSRKNFYKKYILKEKIEDSESEYLRMGDLIDYMITRPNDNIEDKFAVISVNRGTSQIFDLEENLWKATVKCLDNKNNCTREFSELFSDAFNATKYNFKGEEVAFKGKTIEKALESFVGSPAETLYKERRESFGKTIVSINEIEIATKLKEEVLNTPWTNEILATNSDEELFLQVTHEYEVERIEFKSMFDVIKVNNSEKTVKIWDIKSTFDSELFQYNFLKNMYYIQAGLYTLGAIDWANQNGFEGYQVDFEGFIVVDTSFSNKPVIFETGGVSKYLNGFDFKDRHYDGVYEIIKKLKYHENSGEWKLSQEAYENNGRIKLPDFK